MTASAALPGPALGIDRAAAGPHWYAAYTRARHERVVAGELAHRLRILTAPGCLYLVSDSRGPLAIPPAEIGSVEILAAGARHGSAVGPCPFLRTGRRVRAVQGPLAGLEGILESNRRLAAVVVSVTALASSLRVEVAPEDVEPV